LEKLYETNDLIGEEYIDARSVDAFKKKKPPTPVQTQAQQEDEDFEDEEEDYVAPTTASVNRDPTSKSKSTDTERKHLIENQTDFYKSIGSETRLKTTLMVNRPNSSMSGKNYGGVQFDDEKGSYVESDSDMDYSMIDEEEDRKEDDEAEHAETESSENLDDDDKSVSSGNSEKLAKSVKEMANILVKSVINLAIADVQTMAINGQDIKKSGGKDIEKMYRYCFSALTKSEQSNSRLGYYKEYNTKSSKKKVPKNEAVSNGEVDEDAEENKFAIEFEDEPYE
jgi:hypothetical protein